jgi:hypothetical protein
MPPKCAVLLVANGEIVGKVTACGDGALRETNGAVHGVETLQSQTVPMECQPLVCEVVVYVDDDSVSGASLNGRPWECACWSK